MSDPATDSSNQQPLRFEQAIDQLEDLVEQIESGEVGLEDALARYEQGQALVKRCRGILDQAEQKIAELTIDADGQPQASPDDLSTD